MSHKITVICDHGDGPGGLALAVVVAVVLLFGSGAAAVIGHALMVLLIVAAIVAAVLAVLGIVAAVLVSRRRSRRLREGLPPPLWRPVLAPPAPHRALAPGRAARRPAAILAPRELPRATSVIRGHAEPVDAPAVRGGRHAQRSRA